ncbi:MAG: DUF4350 domain-containing protein [Flavobacteriaceae bacterium]
MGKKGNVYIIIAVVTLAVLMLLQYNQPKEINWFPSYVAQHKIPYGTFVLSDVMKKMFPVDLEQVNKPPFEFLTDTPEAHGTYFFVDDKVTYGESELNTLLDWAHEGNTLFIASRTFEDELLDTLNLKTSNLYADFGETKNQLHHLVHPKLKTADGYPFDKDQYTTYFKTTDSTEASILGYVNYFDEDGASQENNCNVIRTTFGKGKIILSTFPNAFTNYFILKENNKDYTAGLLSYLDATSPIYIDQYYKSGKTFYTSPMYLFLNTKEFKWAYYLALIGVLFYVIFEGKRKQRAIPVVLPLKNQTLAFTRTIGDMYFEKGETKAISDHKIAHFMEYIRSHFYMGTQDINEEFYKNLAARSHHSVEDIKALFTQMERMKKSEALGNEELKKLNNSIESFKKIAHGK